MAWLTKMIQPFHAPYEESRSVFLISCSKKYLREDFEAVFQLCVQKRELFLENMVRN